MGKGHEAKLCYIGHVPMDRGRGLAVRGAVAPATGKAERETALEMLCMVFGWVKAARCKGKTKSRGLYEVGWMSARAWASFSLTRVRNLRVAVCSSPKLTP